MAVTAFLKRSTAICAALLLGWAVPSALAPDSANAALGACGPSSKSFSDGADSPALTSNFGVQADIETNEPALCSSSGGSPSLSNAWAMLTPYNNQWAQVGYIKVGAESTTGWTTGFHYFTQYTRACYGSPGCNDAFPTRVWGDPGTATHTYRVFHANDGLIHMYVDGNSQGNMNRNVGGEWPAAWAGNFAGETFDWQSDVPGTNADRTRFNYIKRLDVDANTSFIPSLDGVTPGSVRYHQQIGDAAVGGKYLDIWTDPLTN